MKSGGKRTFMVWLGFAISAGAIYLAFKDEDMGKVYTAMTRANWFILILSMPIMIFTVILRAWRWRYFLKNDTTPIRSRYNAVSIGFFVTNILPLRLGEFARVLVFARRAKRSRVEVFATIAVERFFDILALLILFVIVLPKIPMAAFLDSLHASKVTQEPGYYRYLPQVAIETLVSLRGLINEFSELVFNSPRTLMLSSIIIVISSLVGFLLLCHFGRRVWHWLVESRGIKHPTLLKIVGSLFDGLETLWHDRKVLPALFVSMVLWFTVAFNFWVTLFAFPSGDTTLGAIVGIHGSVFLDTVLCFGVAAPSAPGFFGVWQLFTKAAFVPYPQADSSAVSAFAILVFLIQYVFTLILGMEALKSEGMSLSDVRRAESEEQSDGGA